MSASGGTNAYTDLTRLVAVFVVLALMGTGCGKKRDAEVEEGTLDPEPITFDPGPSAPEPLEPMPPEQIQVAGETFTNVKHSLMRCGGGGALQGRSPLASYLKSMLLSFMGSRTGYSGGYGFTSSAYSGDRGVVGGSRGAACLGHLGNAIQNLSRFGGSYGESRMTGFIGNAVNWIYERIGNYPPGGPGWNGFGLGGGF